MVLIFLETPIPPQGTQDPVSCTESMRLEGFYCYGQRWSGYSALCPAYSYSQPRTTNNTIQRLVGVLCRKRKIIPSKVSNLWRCISENKKGWEKGVHPQDFTLWFLNLRVLFFFHGRSSVFFFLAIKLFQWGCGISFLLRHILGFGIFLSKHAGPALHHSVKHLSYPCFHQIMACYCWLHCRSNFLKHIKARKQPALATKRFLSVSVFRGGTGLFCSQALQSLRSQLCALHIWAFHLPLFCNGYF